MTTLQFSLLQEKSVFKWNECTKLVYFYLILKIYGSNTFYEM